MGVWPSKQRICWCQQHPSPGTSSSVSHPEASHASTGCLQEVPTPLEANLLPQESAPDLAILPVMDADSILLSFSVGKQYLKARVSYAFESI
jgi:hypothetical protein